MKLSNGNAYVSLGSNLGDRAGHLLLALRGIIDAGMPILCLSSVYETEPIGEVAQPKFLNMVAEISVENFTAEQVLARLLRVEFALGRTREVHQGPRTIDLDLLLFKKEVRETEFLTLPHPRMHLRRFVLEPLREISPKLVHPKLNKTAAELLETIDDRSEVKRFKFQG
jgi:2-amino-4-hydroxy-6-hydroxymethyldihydropteridine diphosphokinase